MALGICLAGALVSATAEAKDPYSPPVDSGGHRIAGRQGCPPKNQAPIPADKTMPAPAGWFMGSYHWKDAKGNDLTVEEWCIKGELPYFSERVIQSKNGVENVVAAPTGVGGTEDPGFC